MLSVLLATALLGPVDAEPMAFRLGPSFATHGEVPFGLVGELTTHFERGGMVTQVAAGLTHPVFNARQWLLAYSQLGVGVRLGSMYGVAGAQLRLASDGNRHSAAPAPYVELGLRRWGLYGVRVSYELFGAELERFGSDVVHPIELSVLGGVTW